MIEDKLIDFWRGRWPHFGPHEVLSPDGIKQLSKGDLVLFPEALDKLNMFRHFIGGPLLINHGGLHLRGFRSHEENQKAGGAEHSKHMQGVAFDVTVVGMSVQELYEKAIQFGWHGVGKYPSKGFVHVDMRPRLDGRQVVWEE